LVNKLKRIVRSGVLAAVILSAANLVHATGINPLDPFADLNAGAAGPTNWRILTLGGCTSTSGPCNTGTTNLTINKNSQVYDGNVGVSPSGNLTLATNGSKIVGNVYMDGTNKYTVPAGTNIFGTVYQGTISQPPFTSTNTLLISAASAAMLAYNDAASDTTCQGVTSCSSYTAINDPASNITITGGAGLNIIDLTNLQLNAGSLILSDSFAGATFLIDITGAFSVTNGASITESGGLPNFNVLFNVEGSGTTVCISVSSSTCSGSATPTATTVGGIVLAPFRTVTLDAAVVDGEVIAGGSGGLTLTNNSVIDAPEPATWMLLSTGLAGWALRIRRRARG
jgi:hypothetical protein